MIGGSGRNRTGVDGFAIRCITTLPPSLEERVFKKRAVYRLRLDCHPALNIDSVGKTTVITVAGWRVQNASVESTQAA